jgi:hypothetical protein
MRFSLFLVFVVCFLFFSTYTYDNSIHLHVQAHEQINPYKVMQKNNITQKTILLFPKMNCAIMNY